MNEEMFGELELKFCGNEILKEEVVKCRSCNEDLVHLMYFGGENEFKMQFRCPFCGDRSKLCVIQGRAQLGATDKTKLGGIDYEKDIEVVNCYKNV